MDELFKKTNEFLVKFYAILKELEESIKPSAATGYSDDYYIKDELDYIFDELWKKESKYYLFGAREQYQNTRNYELKELNDKGVYFHLCKFKVYEKTYKERLNKFQEIYVDAQEISFLEDELEAYSDPIGLKEPFKYLDLKQKKDLTFTRKRTVDFLVQQAKTTGYNIIVSGDESDGALSYVMEKIKNIAHSPLLELNSTINETKPPKNLDYLKIGALIAQEDIKNPDVVGNPDVVEKELSDFIENVEEKQNLIEALKKKFPTEKGKGIKAMIKILQENDIIIIPDRQFKEFYTSLKNDFKRDIGSYTSINDVKDTDFDKTYLDLFKKKLTPLITKYKSL